MGMADSQTFVDAFDNAAARAVVPDQTSAHSNVVSVPRALWDALLAARAELEPIERAETAERDAYLQDEAAAALRATVSERRLAELLRMDTPWPLRSIVERLADAADHLLSFHACDADCHEGMRYAELAAREWLTVLDRQAREAGARKEESVHDNSDAPKDVVEALKAAQAIPLVAPDASEPAGEVLTAKQVVERVRNVFAGWTFNLPATMAVELVERYAQQQVDALSRDYGNLLREHEETSRQLANANAEIEKLRDLLDLKSKTLARWAQTARDGLVRSEWVLADVDQSTLIDHLASWFESVNSVGESRLRRIARLREAALALDAELEKFVQSTTVYLCLGWSAVNGKRVGLREALALALAPAPTPAEGGEVGRERLPTLAELREQCERDGYEGDTATLYAIERWIEARDADEQRALAMLDTTTVTREPRS
jgi:hypothetical protein